jgi:hypothetical protein
MGLHAFALEWFPLAFNDFRRLLLKIVTLKLSIPLLRDVAGSSGLRRGREVAGNRSTASERW